MKRILGLFVLLFLACAGISWGETVVVAGTGDSQDLFRGLAQAFHEKFPQITVDVPDSIGSSGGIKAAAKGDCDFGRIARRLKDKENAEYGLSYKLIAFSPIVFVTHAQVKGVRDLSRKQLLSIYTGAVTNWKELGGPDLPIFVANREKGDSSRSVLEKMLPGVTEKHDTVGQTYTSTPDNLEALLKNPGAIGYLPIAMAGDPGMNILSVEGIEASHGNVLSGQYDLVTPFGLVWKEPLKESAWRFLAYLVSPEGQEVIRKFGVVPTN